MAFACIHIPDFPVQAATRGEPELTLRPHKHTQGKGGRALALLEGATPHWRVVAASAAALRAGIEIGMAKTQAEQFAGVEMRLRSPEQERNAHAALLDLGGSFSPRVEDTALESIVLDLTGLDALFGDAEGIARRLAQGALEVCGMAAHVAVAPNPDAALHAARGFAGVTVIAASEEAARLGPLPIDVLGASTEALETLDRWGVRNCAALAALPVLELSERLGAEGVRLHQWARGTGQRSLRLAEPALSFEEVLELDYEVVELEPLAFLLSRLLETLCARLEARSLAAGAVKMRLVLARQARSAHKTGGIPRCARNDELSQLVKCLNLSVPLRNARLLLNLLRLQLQGEPPCAPVRGIYLAVEPARPHAAQGGFFAPSGPDPEKLELTLAKLAHLVGESCVGSPQLADTHRPDAFRMRRFVPATAGASAAAGGPEHRSGFRIFRPALPAQVEMHAGRPARVFFRGLRGTVVAASGPWRGSGDWWEKDSWQQEEWDIEVRFTSGRQTRHALYRLAYDEVHRQWLVRGVFD
jgi:protein ImuB